MRLFAPAKLNLNLRIVGKREDGFHLLQSLVAFLSLADEIEIAPASGLSLEIAGPFGGQISAADNLVLRAARALDASRGAKITLHKNIPVGAGLGGGSADAACVLKGLNQFWGLKRSEAELLEIAAKLGSDVPACIHSKPLWMEDTGGKLIPVSFQPAWHVVLVYPHVLLTAKEVYSRMAAPYSHIQPIPQFKNDVDWLEYLQREENDLTPAATSIHPEIARLMETMSQLPDVLFARMSGSGSTCFSVFENGEDAKNAATSLQHEFPNYWVRATQLIAN